MLGRINVVRDAINSPASVRCWHETDMPTAVRDVRSQGQSGKHMLGLSSSQFDPTETSDPLCFSRWLIAIFQTPLVAK